MFMPLLSQLQLLMNRRNHTETKSLDEAMTDGQTTGGVTTEMEGTPGSVQGRMMRGEGGTGLTRHVPPTQRSLRDLMKLRLVI